MHSGTLDIQDCFTQSNFFQITLRLLLLLFLSLFLPLRDRELSSPVVLPLIIRRSPRSLFAADPLCGGDPRYMASSGARSVLSVGIECTRESRAGRVLPRVGAGNLVGVVGEMGEAS
jgi:hypothetical protein